MDGDRIYLDHNASTPLCAAAREAIAGALDGTGGNPSSIHAEGRRARALVERARAQVAGLISGEPAELVLCSSGTEAVAIGVIGAARAQRSGAPPRLLIGASEHPAGRGAADALAREGFAVKALRVDRAGVIDLDNARAALLGGAAVVAISLANHEVGTLQPIAELAELTRAAGARLVVDAVQAAGKLALSPAELGADAVAISGHKIYGPRGIGAVWLAPDLVIDAVVGGGHQERERRPGIENVLGAVGMGAAAEVAVVALDRARASAVALTRRFEEGLASVGGEVVGAAGPRIGNTTCVRFAGIRAEVLVQALDLEGFAVSAGAACTSGRLEPSPVLMAMGFTPEESLEAVRVSVGRDNTESEVDVLLQALGPIVERARRFGR